jgi:hypothetical protein
MITEPLALLAPLDVGTTRSLWHGKPRRRSPWHLQSPSPRPRRPPHLDGLQGARGRVLLTLRWEFIYDGGKVPGAGGPPLSIVRTRAHARNDRFEGTHPSH